MSPKICQAVKRVNITYREKREVCLAGVNFKLVFLFECKLKLS